MRVCYFCFLFLRLSASYLPSMKTVLFELVSLSILCVQQTTFSTQTPKRRPRAFSRIFRTLSVRANRVIAYRCFVAALRSYSALQPVIIGRAKPVKVPSVNFAYRVPKFFPHHWFPVTFAYSLVKR